MKALRELSERKAAILRALVRLYIRTGEPVGSEALAASAGLGVSPATIRNELASLEEMGYLTQPHTSAGRAPTDLAYRSYVDMLPARPRLRDPERKAIVHFFDEALADVDDILRGTTHLLSRLTRYASLALAPSQRETAIARAELVRLGTATLLLVVFDTGQVDKRLIDLPAEAFNRRETLRQIYEALERESAVLGLLREAAANAPLGVMIGRENAMPEMWEASVVAAPFAAGGAIGSIGVVGPLRMDYAVAISAVRAVAERLSAAVEALSH